MPRVHSKTKSSGLGLVLAAGIISLLFAIFLTALTDVIEKPRYSFSLDKNKITSGENLTIYFDIAPSKGQVLNNTFIKFYIVQNDKAIKEFTVDAGLIDVPKKGKVEVDLDFLQAGSYVLKTRVVVDSKDGKALMSPDLTLNFDVYKDYNKSEGSVSLTVPSPPLVIE